MATRYYTGAGDGGETGVGGGARVAKSSALVEAIGNVDELNSYLGVCLFYIRDEAVRGALCGIQNELFIIGAGLASATGREGDKTALDSEAVARLEEQIRRLSSGLPELRQFVMPRGCEAAAHLHVARALARRAERRIVAAAAGGDAPDRRVIAYVNRLSSFLFVAALYLNRIEGTEEEHPTY